MMHPRNSNLKNHKSVFVPEHAIDLPNFLTEILIRNFLVIFKKPIPNCPFWRKEISDGSKELSELSKKYQLELIGVKELLDVFDPEVLAKDFTDNKRIGFKFRKKEYQIQMVYDLFVAQRKFLKTREQDVDLPVASKNYNTVASGSDHNKGMINL